MAKRSKVQLYEAIRRAHAAQETKSIRALSRQFRVHRRDVRAALESAEPAPRKTSVRPAPKMDQWKPIIEGRYATALGDSGLAVSRHEVDERMAAPDPDFAVRYVHGRLAVLDGDVGRVVELLGGDLDAPYHFIRVAEAISNSTDPTTRSRGLDVASTRPAGGRSPSCTTSPPA